MGSTNQQSFTFDNAGFGNEARGGFQGSVEHHETGPSHCDDTVFTIYTITHSQETLSTKKKSKGLMTWQNGSSLTCAGPARHAVGLSLIVSIVILDAHQVRVSLGAEVCADADDMLVGRIYHLLHL